MPAHTTALLMEAPPGAEKSCRAHSYAFKEQGTTVERGVITHYAAQALPQAVTAADWLRDTNARSHADVQSKRLPPSHALTLQVAGDPATTLPGHPVPAAAPRSRPR